MGKKIVAAAVGVAVLAGGATALVLSGHGSGTGPGTGRAVRWTRSGCGPT